MTGRNLKVREAFLIRVVGLGICTAHDLVISAARKALKKPSASRFAATAFPHKSACCPKAPARKASRAIYKAARDRVRAIAKTDAYVASRRQRKKVEMLFAHLKRILKLDRLRLRGPDGAKDEFLLAATAQNFRKLAKLIPSPALAPA